jgi:hypothetical protein
MKVGPASELAWVDVRIALEPKPGRRAGPTFKIRIKRVEMSRGLDGFAIGR